jgi:hypothetical protein
MEPEDVRPLDVDGVRAVAIGTVLWAVALVALLPFWGRLADDGRLWWIGACAAGTGLGLLGLVYVTRRRNAIRTAAAKD